MLQKTQLFTCGSIRVSTAISKTTFATLVAVALMLFSCNKEDEFKNLNTTISGESTLLGTVEGGAVIANVNLSEELSEDLILDVKIEIDSINNYINPEDYNPNIEYSTDLGSTWTKAVNQQIIFNKEKRSLKIRIKTIDDDKLEFHEAFDLVLTPKPGAKLNVAGEIPTIRVNVEDNEPDNATNIMGALFEIDANNNFKMVKLNRGLGPLDKHHKALIDNGPSEAVKNDLIRTYAIGGIPINTFEAMYERSGLGGYVFNPPTDTPGEDNWQMGLNLYFAYYDYSDPENGNWGAPLESYNSNGANSYLLAHEYAHILTLNQKYEADITISEDDCTEYFLSEGCLRSDSVVNQFYETFYETEEIFNEPTYVTEYALTNVAEDIAETFAFAMAQPEIPPLTESSSGALRKIHFINNHPHLDGVREKMRSILPFSTVSTTVGFGGEKPIRAFNITKNGKYIPSWDYQAILKAHKKGHFELD